MDSRSYEQRRNELLSLLDAVLEIRCLEPRTTEAIRQIRKKSLENQFEVCLAGAFQGGKSTTFNALCDGREISPVGRCGGGLKTSACLLSAMNLADAAEPERAEITWRSKQQLALGLAELIQGHCAAHGGFRREESYEEFAAHFDLDDAGHLGLATAALQEQWQRQQSSPGAYPAERLDLLRIATLIVRFYPMWKQRGNSTSRISIPELQGLVAFPQDWEQRWADGFCANFRQEETVFVFVARVLVRIHSGNLARLGCVVTDCPGLFASAWDTRLAEQAMSEADAIWYLSNGVKTLTDGDVKAIRFITDRGWARKLFYSVNCRGNAKHNILNRIIPKNVEILNSRLQLAVKPEQLVPYDAFLAFYSGLGQNLLDGALDEHTRSGLVAEGQALGRNDLTADGIWLKLICRQLVIQNLDPTRVKGLDSGAVAFIRHESNLPRLLDQIESFVVTHKAASILVHQGAEPVAEALVEFEGALAARERHAQQAVDEFTTQVTAEALAMADFVQNASRQLDPLRNGKDGIAQALAEDFIDTVLVRKEAVDRLCDRVADEIVTQVFGAKPTMVDLAKVLLPGRKKEYEERADEVCKSVLEDLLSAATIAWDERLRKGENQRYNAVLAFLVRRCSDNLQFSWRQYRERVPTLEGVGLPELTGVLSADRLPWMTDLQKRLPPITRPAFGEVFDAVRTSLLELAFLAIVAVAKGFLGTLGLGTIITEALLAHRALQKEISVDGLKDGIAQRLRSDLYTTFDTRRKEMIQQAEAAMARYPEVYLTAFDAALKTIADELEARVESARQDLNRSQAERNQVAADAQHNREQVIMPMRVRVGVFRDQVLAAAQPQVTGDR